MKNLFDTKKKIEAAVSGFTNLLTQPGWKLVEQIIDANIKVVTELILNGKNSTGEEATKEESDRLRDKLRVYKEVRDTPRRMIKRFTSGGSSEPVIDPFETVKQLREERAKIKLTQ